MAHEMITGRLFYAYSPLLGIWKGVIFVSALKTYQGNKMKAPALHCFVFWLKKLLNCTKIENWTRTLHCNPPKPNTIVDLGTSIPKSVGKLTFPYSIIMFCIFHIQIFLFVKQVYRKQGLRNLFYLYDIIMSMTVNICTIIFLCWIRQTCSTPLLFLVAYFSY